METFDIKVNGKNDLAINLKTKVTGAGDVGVVRTQRVPADT